MAGSRGTLLVVGHPNVVPHNQLIYVRMAELGWDLKLIVPSLWVDEYSPGGFRTQPVRELVGTFARVRVAVRGEPLRHVYITSPSRWLKRWRPDVVFIENDPTAIPTLQWGLVCERLGIPWGIQGDENLDRPFPWPAILIRRWSLSRTDFIGARSPTAASRLKQWGARGAVATVSHTIPEWSFASQADDELFTVGFAGRLVTAKGIDDLIAAAQHLDFPFRLLVVGDGVRRGDLERAKLGRGTLELHTGVRTDAMPDLYRRMHVLVLPSRTTRTWAEQFGKVLCEALMCGVPLIGSSSGAIPWVIQSTGGGDVFPEGDAQALARLISEIRADPPRRLELARRGREGVERHFSPRAAARDLDHLIRIALPGAPTRPEA